MKLITIIFLFCLCLRPTATKLFLATVYPFNQRQAEIDAYFIWKHEGGSEIDNWNKACDKQKVHMIRFNVVNGFEGSA